MKLDNSNVELKETTEISKKSKFIVEPYVETVRA